MNFETEFFDKVVEQTMFYSPKIEIKPAHLANGFFRAVCGKYANASDQHAAINPKVYPGSVTLPSLLGDEENKRVREMLHALLGADATLYSKVNFSSYSLSHVTQITSDNHDRGAGEWLYAILEHDSRPSPALTLLRELLTEEDRRRSDELSTLTLPLAPDLTTLQAFNLRMSPNMLPESLRVDETGAFADPVIKAIREGFDRLAEAEDNAAAARYGAKLDVLRRLVTWGCFAVYLHLANLGCEQSMQRVPLLLCMPGARMPTLQQASIQSYQWVSRSIDTFFRNHIRQQVEQLRSDGTYGEWDSDEAIEHHIQTMTWKTVRGGMRSRTRGDQDNARDCLSFYRSYRSETAGDTPYIAFANAVADMLDRVLSSSPDSVARALGVRIGLLPASRGRTQKLYAPQPDLLEVLVRASVPKKEQWSINKLADHWSKQYGVLFGALGDENQRLAE